MVVVTCDRLLRVSLKATRLMFTYLHKLPKISLQKNFLPKKRQERQKEHYSCDIKHYCKAYKRLNLLYHRRYCL